MLARRERVDDRRELGHRLVRPVDEEERRAERVRRIGPQPTIGSVSGRSPENVDGQLELTGTDGGAPQLVAQHRLELG